MGLKGRIFLAVLFIVLVLIYVFYPTDKKRIKNVIENSTEAITEEDMDGLMEHISFNYRDDYGGGYLVLKKRMEKGFARFDDIDITADIMRVSVEGEKAEAELKLNVIASEGTDRGYVIGEAGSHEDIRIYLEKSPYEWKIIKIEGVVKRHTQSPHIRLP